MCRSPGVAKSWGWIANARRLSVGGRPGRDGGASGIGGHAGGGRGNESAPGTGATARATGGRRVASAGAGSTRARPVAGAAVLPRTSATARATPSAGGETPGSGRFWSGASSEGGAGSVLGVAVTPDFA
jgi:hypothetical protein